MSYRLRRKKILEAIMDHEQIDGLVHVNVPGEAKYKKSYGQDSDELPSLRVGDCCILRVSGCRNWRDKMSIIGYMGCVIIDWKSYDHFWYHDTKIICQIVAVSRKRLAHRIGRFTSGTWVGPKEKMWQSANSGVVAFGRAKFEKYKINIFIDEEKE